MLPKIVLHSAEPTIQPTSPRVVVVPTPSHVAPTNVDFPMTIRLRLTLWYTALLGSTLILFSFIFYSTLAANLWMQTQQEAARQASEVANTLALQLQGNILII